MKKLLTFILPLLTLLGCGGSAGQFSLRGDFDHLEQGEFFLYSPDGGLNQLDTLHIKDGEFKFTTPLQGHATYYILYPNFSELAIFGQEGQEVHIKGDARSLNEVEVKGTKDNEIYTKFRKDCLNLTGKKIDTLARDYILLHPTLELSKFLFNKYFLIPKETDNNLMQEVYDSLCRANPSDVYLSNLSNRVRRKNILKIGTPIPPFQLTTRRVELRHYKNNKTEKRVIESRQISDTTFTNQPILMVFWASWRSGSASGIYRARKTLQKYPEKIQVISYSLDVEDSELKALEQRDTIDYPNYCDFLCWNSPLVQKWNICELPYFILLDKDHKIKALGENWAKDIEPHIDELCS